MVSTQAFLLSALVAFASASPCKPTTTTVSPAATPTLPSSGTSPMPVPPEGVTLKKIAIGHGIQNYTCGVNQTTAANSTGALAVLYDVTSLYPGTVGTGINQSAWDALPSTVLWTVDIPLNLVNTDATAPGAVLAESGYVADIEDPFPAPSDLDLSDSFAPLPFLGHHYFDSTSTPTFDLSAAGLLGNVVKNATVTAPDGADKGVLNTGAVAWLKLIDSGKGIGNGVSVVYRVLTAGGAAQACATSGAGTGSVPYAAYYWFYG